MNADSAVSSDSPSGGDSMRVPMPGPSRDGDVSCACTMEFRLLTVRVADASGAPVRDANIVVRREKTGDVVVRSGPPASGDDYFLFDDNSMPATEPDGDWFVIEATSGGKSGSIRQRLGRTQPCSCHVERKEGPGTVVIR
jgi:hypothetical protein